MKTISQLTTKVVSRILTKHHAFYAFSKAQFNRSANPNFSYLSLGGGLNVPSTHADKVINLIEGAIDAAKVEVMASHSCEEIIAYELGNHEAHISGDLESTLSAVEVFGFTMKDVAAVYPSFYTRCVAEGCF